MYVLGIHTKHDSSACLLKDNKLVAFAEEERFTRKKHQYGFPYHSVRFCLHYAGIDLENVDYVSIGNNTPGRTIKDAWKNYYLNGLFLSEPIKRIPKTVLYNVKQFFNKNNTKILGVNKDQIYWCDHHLAHASSAFRCSPFKESLVLTMDAWGISHQLY